MRLFLRRADANLDRQLRKLAEGVIDFQSWPSGSLEESFRFYFEVMDAINGALL